MLYLDIYLAQLIEPFRIGLLIALVLAASNTAQTLNRWTPIVLGDFFVAVLIPFSIRMNVTVNTTISFLVGIVSNAAILMLLLIAKALYSYLA